MTVLRVGGNGRGITEATVEAGNLMKWFKKLFGIKSPLEKKKSQLSKLQRQAMEAQRNGDLRLAGKLYLEAEVLETEIVEIQGRR